MPSSELPKLIVSIEGRLEHLRNDLRTAEAMVAQSARRMGAASRSRGPRDSLFGMVLSQRDVGSAALPGVTKRMILAMAGLSLTVTVLDQALRNVVKAMNAPISTAAKWSQGFAGFTQGLVQGVQGVPIVGPIRDMIARNAGVLAGGISGNPALGALAHQLLGRESEDTRKNRLAQRRAEGMVTVQEMHRQLSQQAEMAKLSRFRPHVRGDEEIRLKAKHDLDDMLEAIKKLEAKHGLRAIDTHWLRKQANDVNILQLIRDLQESDEKRQMLDLSESVETALGAFKLAGGIGSGSSIQHIPATQATQLEISKNIESIANWLTTAQFGFT